MTNLNNFIIKRASNMYRDKGFTKEYGVFISFVIILKVATSIFSAYAGYYYVKNVYVDVLNNYMWAIAFAIITLVLIEVLTNITLSKFYKTSLRGRIKPAIGLVLLSFVFFGLSFHLSTNGLAQRQSQQTDNSKLIIEKYNTQLSEIKKQTASQKEQMKEAITLIKENPSGWRNGKRDVLLPNQLATITSFYNKIEQLNKDLKRDIEQLRISKEKELKANTGIILEIEDKYYKIVGIIMTIQLFVNGLLMFFYSRIYNEKHKDKLAKEVVQEFASDISQTTDKLIKHNISNAYMNYLSALSFQLKENDTKKTIEKESTNIPKIGFKNINGVINNYDSVITNVSNQESVNNTTNTNNEFKKCKHCNAEFKPYNIRQVYCSSECRLAWHKENKGFELEKYLKRKK